MASAGGTQQFVTFALDRKAFALPMALVKEIVRPPRVHRLPLAPAAVCGVCNLRGRVLPVVDLRALCGYPEREPDDASRVVVTRLSGRVGFLVDRVHRVAAVASDAIRAADGNGAGLDSDSLAGVIEDESGALTQIIDLERVVDKELAIDWAANGASGEAGGGENGASADGRRGGGSDVELQQLISFSVGRQECALPIEAVREIVPMPDEVGQVPRAPGYIQGVISLRRRIVPLVNMRRLLDLPDESRERQRVVVLPLDGDRHDTGGRAVGLVMDSVNEVIRVPADVLDPVPELLEEEDGRREISALCRLDDGRRIVSVLSPERMFQRNDRRAQLEAAAADGAADTETQGGEEIEMNDTYEQFVVFRLAGEEYAVPIASVKEIVRVPDTLMRVPHAPDFVEGVINLRGIVLPVVDQRRRLGLPGADRDDAQRIVVLQLNTGRTGFIVDAVAEVLKIPVSAIVPSPALSSEQAQLVRRVANIAQERRMVMLIEPDRLLSGEEQEAVAELKEEA